MEKPEHFKTEQEARARAYTLAPDLFPLSVCYVHRPDKDGRWHVCTALQAEGRYKDSASTVYVCNDGDVQPAEEEVSTRQRRQQDDGGVGVRRRSRCKGCLRKLDRDELYKIPGRKGRFCMSCATQFTEEDK